MTAPHNTAYLLNSPAESQARYRDKRDRALIWLARWGYSTPAILAATEGLGLDSGLKLTQALLREGRVREISAPHGHYRYEYQPDGSRSRIGPLVLSLTDDGRARAEMLDGEAMALHQLALPQPQSVRHNLLCQRAVASLLRRGTYLSYHPEPASRVASQAATKKPDCVLASGAGELLAIEIELTAKRGQALDRAFLAVVLGLRRGQFQHCTYLFASDHTATAYQAIWNKPLAHWARKSNGQWEKGGQYKDHQDVREHVSFTVSATLREAV